MLILKYPLLVCTFEHFAFLTKKFPNRNVIPDAHVPYNYFYYWTRAGEFRSVIIILTTGPKHE